MERFDVLLIDDDRKYCENFKMFTKNHFKLSCAWDGKSALKVLNQSSPDIIFLDYWLGNQETGLDVLKKIRKIDPNLPVIMISERTSIEVAVEAMKLGAYHYTSKYGSIKELLVLVKQELDRLRDKILWERKLNEEYDPLLGNSLAMSRIKQKIKQCARVDSTVLITGETGSGKELVAWEIHKSSYRQHQPFIAVNCTAIPENLFESEFFGHERGAFTDARQRRIGHFELADGGTLFLDEIGTLIPLLQAKLLRALESKSIQRLGGERKIPVDIRIIAATNIDLKEAIEKNDFRMDLFHRLNVLNIHVPPLQERKEDIPLIANYFLKKYAIKSGQSKSKFTQPQIKRMQKYQWPGNVRELRNAIERYAVLGESALFENLMDESTTGNSFQFSLDMPLLDMSYQEARQKIFKEFQQFYFKGIIQRFNGNIKKAAEWMGVQRTTIYRALSKSLEDGNP